MRRGKILESAATSLPSLFLILCGLLLSHVPARAQEAGDSASTTEESGTSLAPLPESPAPKAADEHSYTTKKLPFAAPAASKPAEPAAPAAVAVKKPAMIPFGKSTASQETPIPSAPHTATAVPVGNVDAIDSSEPAPAEPAENTANPAAEDPAQPTDLTAPIFVPEKSALPRTTALRVLNKVTARSEKIELKPEQSVVSGKLRITASHCQHSAANSLPDDAALVTIAEISDAKQPDKPIFSGWLYQSSPSISGLEHPVYDVSLIACKDAPAAAAVPLAVTAPKKKAKPARVGG